MTRQCKKLLNTIRTFTDRTSAEWSYDHKQNIIWKIGVLNSRQNLSDFSGELDSLVDALIESGYITKSQFGYKLTHKGLHSFEVNVETAKAFLLKSVIVPIVVAAITALITLWIQGLLQPPSNN